MGRKGRDYMRRRYPMRKPSIARARRTRAE